MREKRNIFAWHSHALHIALTLLLSLAALKACLELFLRARYELQGPFTWDTTIYWSVGRGMVNGLLPYRDLFESKPPGIFLVSALSLWTTGDVFLGHVLQATTILALPIALVLSLLRHTGWRWKSDLPLLILAFVFGSILALYTAERSGEFQVESFGAVFGALFVLTIPEPKTPETWKRIFFAALFLLLSLGFKEPFLLSTAAAALLLCTSGQSFLRSYLLPLLIAAVVGVTVMALLHELIPYVTIYLPHMLTRHVGTHGPFLLRGFAGIRLFYDLTTFSGALGILVAALLLLTIIFEKRGVPVWRFLQRLIIIGIALYLTTLSVGLGGEYYNHHFAVAVPAYIALFLLFLRHVRTRKKDRRGRIALVTVMLLTIASAAMLPHMRFEERIAGLRFESAAARASAAEIDRILDACGIDRYLFLGGNGPQVFGFTKHSPIGPLFWQFDPWLAPGNDAFREALLRSVDHASVIYLEYFSGSDIMDDIREEVSINFTNVPWPCAGGVNLAAPEKLLFRKR